MSEQRASIFVTKLKMRKDKNGNDFLIGNIGLAGVMLRPHKTNEGEWNLFILENKPREQQPGYQQSGGGYAGASFENNEEIPF